jgi:hypothetical protein
VPAHLLPLTRQSWRHRRRSELVRASQDVQNVGRSEQLCVAASVTDGVEGRLHSRRSSSTQSITRVGLSCQIEVGSVFSEEPRSFLHFNVRKPFGIALGALRGVPAEGGGGRPAHLARAGDRGKFTPPLRRGATVSDGERAGVRDVQFSKCWGIGKHGGLCRER